MSVLLKITAICAAAVVGATISSLAAYLILLNHDPKIAFNHPHLVKPAMILGALAAGAAAVMNICARHR